MVSGLWITRRGTKPPFSGNQRSIKPACGRDAVPKGARSSGALPLVGRDGEGVESVTRVASADLCPPLPLSPAMEQRAGLG